MGGSRTDPETSKRVSVNLLTQRMSTWFSQGGGSANYESSDKDLVAAVGTVCSPRYLCQRFILPRIQALQTENAIFILPSRIPPPQAPPSHTPPHRSKVTPVFTVLTQSTVHEQTWLKLNQRVKRDSFVSQESLLISVNNPAQTHTNDVT